MLSARRKLLVEKYYQNKISGISLILDNIWDPHNVAAISRSADGFGIHTIFLYYTYNQCPNMRQTGGSSSSSANRWIQWEKLQSVAEVQALKANGARIYAADYRDDALALTQVQFQQPGFIIMGSESKGLSPELRELVDEYIAVPMVGMVESYNVSVATAVILYEVYRQHGQHLTSKVDPALRGRRA